MKFGTILADPPWDYATTSKSLRRTEHNHKLTGYTDMKYPPLTTKRLKELPVSELAYDESVLLLWTTWPFIQDALDVIDAWGFTFVTGVPWVKITKKGDALSYGVGYWFRGVCEPLLVAKRKKSYRTNLNGLLTDPTGIAAYSLGHSRKPKDVYNLAESFPPPRLEMFARGAGRPGWAAIGNEADETKDEDIAESVNKLMLKSLHGQSVA